MQYYLSMYTSRFADNPQKSRSPEYSTAKLLNFDSERTSQPILVNR